MPQPVTEADIRRIYSDTIDGLYAFVARRCDGDRDLAEDVTQETWLRAVRAWQSNGIPKEPAAWLTTVARNILANHFRRPAPELLGDVVDDAPDPDAVDAIEERHSLLARALARLPLPQLRLLEAFHFQRQPVADIARTEGISARAVEGRLRRARQHLREQIESEPNITGDES